LRGLSELSLLFASAIVLAGPTTSGCGPCRVISFDYEKVLPLDELTIDPDLPLTAQCADLCGYSSGTLISCDYTTPAGGEPSLACLYEVNQDCGGIGRKPPGMRMAVGADDDAYDALGRHFALVAQLEAASVDAFEHLRRELCAHAAPRGLRTRARQAARDERRHAAVTAKLARRFGVAPRRPTVPRAEIRNLEAIARDNALEGCVRETLGAAVAGYQARHARDAAIARVMRRIAVDETRHAALGWALHAWLRRRVDRARMRAIEQEAHATAHALRLSRETAPELRSLAGFPTIEEHRRLAHHVATGLWGAA
jgi:hypothetical protein